MSVHLVKTGWLVGAARKDIPRTFMVHRHTLVRFFVSSAYIYQNCLCNFIRMAYEFGRTIFVIHKRVLVVL